MSVPTGNKGVPTGNDFDQSRVSPLVKSKLKKIIAKKKRIWYNMIEFKRD